LLANDAVLPVFLLCYSGGMPTDIITTGEIGALIRKRRKELGLSQEQLSEKVGVSYQQIQRYENGGSMLNVENVQRVAHALELPVTLFFAPIQPSIAAEPPTSYSSSEEKHLLKSFRDLTAKSDQQLAVTIIRRLARK
jgi:transcriptional regulator with XRE-family HTH domain